MTHGLIRQPRYHLRSRTRRRFPWQHHRPAIAAGQTAEYHTYYDCPTGKRGIKHGDAYAGVTHGSASQLCILCATQDATGTFTSGHPHAHGTP